jgi:DNA (cytosine-5)-methyltransferase 1
MHNNNTIVPYISLCSGYEGIGLGLHRCISNLRCIAYCEREAFAISNLVAKMEKGLLDEAPVFTDVTTFPWEQFAPYMAGGILSFGWPCQPVSMAGKRKATEDERWLFDIIADGISIMRPGMLFAENVEGLLSAKMPDGSSVFGHCIERLERLHYKVEAGIFSASEVGAPHQRKRIFILAYREEQGLEGLRRLESNFIWNDSWQDGTARGEELAYSCDSANTETGYAEAHRLSSEHRTEVCSRFIGRTDATAKELVYPINDDGSNVSRVKFGQKEQSIFGESSVNVADTNNGRSREDIQSTKSRASWIEQPSFNCGGLQSREIREEQAWPSRPNQPQYAWEPPRVIASERKFADTNDAGWQAGRNNSIPDGGGSGSHRTTSHCSNQAGTVEDTICSGGEESEYQQANLPAESSGGDSESVGNAKSWENNGRESRDMAEASSQRGCCDDATNGTSEGASMGDSSSERPCGGAQNGLGQQSEMFREGHEAMGNSKSGCTGECGNKDSQRKGLGSTWPGSSGDMGNTKQLLFPATREHGAMDEEIRIPTDGERSEPTQADSEPSATRKRESDRSNASEFGEIECSLGGDAYEPSVGVGMPIMPSLCDSELEEIYEWMVKCENRTDELRLLGNGVVPATATKAFITLFNKLK